jgi:hypothetical protein
MESISTKTTEQDEALPEAPGTGATGDVPDNLHSKPLQEVEEIESSDAMKPSPSLAKVAKRDGPTPNPLLEDPYEWERCTITIRYSVLPDHTVSVSVHNHKDEPIVRTFSEAEISLPGRISDVMAMLRTIWPTSAISATMALMPKPADATERVVVTSIRAGGDTPIVQTDVEGNLAFPAQIKQMLDKLKATLPGRALKFIEKSAKTKAASLSKVSSKPSGKHVVKQVATAANVTNKSQMSLF